MTAPLVSVVMSVFNGGRFLSEAIESILNQTFEEFEFIIIDDGSNDGSRELITQYQNRDSRIRLFSQCNSGLVYSLNRGCDLAHGKYIARMDADDVASADRLELQVKFLETHPKISLLGGAVNFIDADGEALLTSRYPETNESIKRHLSDSSAFWHPTVLYKKEAFLFVGGYRDIPDAEDYDLWLRMADHFKLANLKEVVLSYRVHPEQGSVLRCRKQALGTLAAKVSATTRRKGLPDPLISLGEITTSSLVNLGIDDKSLHTAVGRAYLSSVRNMSLLKSYPLALTMLTTLQSTVCEQADAWVIADSYLCAGRIYWSQKKYAISIKKYGRAIVKRPVIVGRPFKTLFKSVVSSFMML